MGKAWQAQRSEQAQMQGQGALVGGCKVQAKATSLHEGAQVSCASYRHRGLA